MSALIREARAGDGAGLAQAALDLTRQYIELEPDRFKFPDGDLAGWLEAELAEPVGENATWLVAEIDGKAVGGIEASILEPVRGADIQSQRDVALRRVYVNYLAVQEASRGQGIGTLLLSAVEQWARTKGAELILTDTNLLGPATGFYEKNGFSQQSVILRKPLL